MGRKEKLRARLESLPKDFTWDELMTVLRSCGFETINGSGSRYKFVHITTRKILSFHKPHPGNIVKEYILKDVVEALSEIR